MNEHDGQWNSRRSTNRSAPANIQSTCVGSDLQVLINSSHLLFYDQRLSDTFAAPTYTSFVVLHRAVESSWNVMAHCDAREAKWKGNWWMERVASTLHTTSEHGVSSITTADAHTSAASSRLNWRPSPFKWTRPVRRKTKSRFCACAITFQLASKVRGSNPGRGTKFYAPVQTGPGAKPASYTIGLLRG
jgi:hypothetical protein